MPKRRYLWIVFIVAAFAAIYFLFMHKEMSDQIDPVAPEAKIPVQASVPNPLRATPAAPATPASAEPGQTVRATVTHADDARQGRFTGRVLNAGSNELVPGAEIVFSHLGSAESVRTGADGQFRFEPSSLGVYQLATVSAEGFFAYAPQWEQSPIELVARAQVQVDGIVVYLTPALDYKGRVVDTDGKAVAGATITISSSKEAVLSAEEGALQSDVHGDFDFHARDGSLLKAQSNGKAGYALVDSAVQISHRLQIVIGAGHPTMPMDAAHSFEAGDASQEQGRAILRGRVVDADGQPVPSFNVMLTRARGIASATVAERAVFDGAGEFSFEGLVENSYRVHVAATGWAMGSADAVARIGGGTRVVVQLAGGATLFGQVLDAMSKEPLALAKVTLEMSFGSGSSARPMVVSSVTDATGHFELSGLGAGRRSVYVAAANHHSQIVSALDIADGARLGPITVELSPVAEGETPSLELAGIGVVLGPEEQGMLVRDTIAGGGAQEAGILAQDIILSIDGQAVVELGWDDSIQRIRGPVGSTVRLLLRRGDEQLDLLVTRRAIRT